MSYPVAATFGLSHFTAHAALHYRAGLRTEETVLATGVRGDVGRAVVQLAKLSGATVFAAARDPESARSELHDHVEDVVAADPDSIAETVKQGTGGRGADVVVDVVGGDLLGQLVRTTAWEGRLVTVGFAGGAPAPIKPGHLLVRNISVSGLQSTDYWTRHPDLLRATLGELVSLVDAGSLSVPSPPEFRLDEMDAAIRALESRDSRRAVVVVFDQDELIRTRNGSAASSA